ncbi:hypothetical protein [Rhodopirellula sallentina]|uniref:Uncharacterized protein n=1 Tax=Rhodopirellula sallentina SM41 TaxID=1263870 RepID=M5UDV0_9BACT|nr:hypothetical protein [Rhodopirellula sallentina]EMI54168.1 hypothetical protein RSSM_04387 [Rhodopirellula sallentina SM41]
MTVHDPAFTDEDYAVLLQALSTWEELGTSETATNRKVKMVLLKAKLAIQRSDAYVDRLFDRGTELR